MTIKTPQYVNFLHILEREDPEAATIFRSMSDIHNRVGDAVFDLMVKIIKTGGLVLDGDAPAFVTKITECLHKGTCPIKPIIIPEGTKIKTHD